ncbi:transporter [Kiloniella litopenaei]|uniref:Transporter n=1 Tax=Kiloniella litopenaei TaxID=1549748 RepID=A0A0M2R5Y7_9PROT|nr:putative transporter [Kiloniella litopenaei]KKJ77277.1 transporter [Kiloniella litopenaei]
MFHSFFKSRKWALWAYGGSIILLSIVWVQVQISVILNKWYEKFYDLLQKAGDFKDNPEEGIRQFYETVFGLEYLSTWTDEDLSFLVIVMPLVILSVFANWFTRIYVLRWREAMTFNFIPRWRSVKKEIEGASQRIQEDCHRFAVIVEHLGTDIVNSLLTLIAFIPILWTLSEKVEIPYIKDIDGSLVWLSLIVSVGGVITSWIIGSKLPGIEYDRQKTEAAFRKDLVLGEEDKVNFAQPNNLLALFTGVKFNAHRLYRHYSYFDLWRYSYKQLMSVAPLIIMGPSLFTQTILLGILMQTANAYGQVHGSFSYFLDNWTIITELRSIYKRLHEFENNLRKHEEEQVASAIPETGE